MNGAWAHKKKIVGGIACIGVLLLGGFVYSSGIGSSLLSATTTYRSASNEQNASLVAATEGGGSTATSSDDWRTLVSATTGTGSATKAANTTDDEPDTTDRVARRFFAHYMQLKEEGGLTQQNAKELINAVIGQSNVTISAPNYTEQDLAITPEQSRAAIRRYAQALADTINSHTPEEPINEFAVALRAMHGEDRKELARLDPNIAGYADLTESLRALETPRPMAKIHLDIVNSVAGVHTTIEAMRTYFDDPITALTALRQYPDRVERMQEALRTLDRELGTYDIDLNPSQ